MRKEGDVWVERGKTWTIKNGIKRTVSRFSEVRKDLQMPLCCPKCSRALKGVHANIYKFNKVCLDCTVEFEHELIKQGKYKEYEQKRIEANVKGYVLDLATFFDEFANESTNKSYITEDGDVESWIGNTTERLKEVMEPKITELVEKYANTKS